MPSIKTQRKALQAVQSARLRVLPVSDPLCGLEFGSKP